MVKILRREKKKKYGDFFLVFFSCCVTDLATDYYYYTYIYIYVYKYTYTKKKYIYMYIHVYFKLFIFDRLSESGIVTLHIDSKPTPVFCHVGDVGCGNGIWTPVMKIDGNKVCPKFC